MHTPKVVPQGSRRVLSGDGGEERTLLAYCPSCHRTLPGHAPSSDGPFPDGESEETEERGPVPPPPPGAARVPVGALMTRTVVCVRQDLSVETLEDILIEREISGAPVVGDDGKMIGFVTATDIVREVLDGGHSPHSGAASLPQWGDDARIGPRGPGGEFHEVGFHEAGFHEQRATRTVREIMHPVSLEVDESCPVGAAAALMAKEGVHHLPVVAGNAGVVGVLTSLDVLRWLAQESSAFAGSGNPQSGPMRKAREVPPDDAATAHPAHPVLGPTPEPRLIETDRLAAVGSLAAGVAHEISNALTGARLVLGRLLTLELSRRPVTPLQHHRIDMLQDVRDSFSRVERIVRGLRKFSCMDEEEKMEPVDIAEVLDAVTRVAAHEVGHRARLACDYGRVPPVFGRRAQLQSIFLNLLVNATQAIPEGKAHENAIRVVTRTDEAGRVVIEVTDTGTGILPEHLPHIFDPFFTTKPPSRGFGLGLSVARDIVTSLGGEILAESAIDRGTTFRVVLPPCALTARAAVASAAPGKGAASASREGGDRVLIVDDEPKVAEAIAFALDGDVVVAASGREALDILRSDPKFDVVLCDLMMPEITGMDLYEAIVLLDPALAGRFAFMTGGAFTARAQRFLSSVPNPHIEKPFKLEDLRAFVRSAADGRR